jgi:hypothetical protein
MCQRSGPLASSATQCQHAPSKETSRKARSPWRPTSPGRMQGRPAQRYLSHLDTPFAPSRKPIPVPTRAGRPLWRDTSYPAVFSTISRSAREQWSCNDRDGRVALELLTQPEGSHTKKAVPHAVAHEPRAHSPVVENLLDHHRWPAHLDLHDATLTHTFHPSPREKKVWCHRHGGREFTCRDCNEQTKMLRW